MKVTDLFETTEDPFSQTEASDEDSERYMLALIHEYNKVNNPKILEKILTVPIGKVSLKSFATIDPFITVQQLVQIHRILPLVLTGGLSKKDTAYTIYNLFPASIPNRRKFVLQMFEDSRYLDMSPAGANTFYQNFRAGYSKGTNAVTTALANSKVSGEVAQALQTLEQWAALQQRVKHESN